MKQALIVIDVQESFRHRPFWDDSELPAFLAQVQALIDGCWQRDIPVLQVFHVNAANDPASPFAPASGHVVALRGLRIAPTAVFRKTVHSSLYARDEAGHSLHDWLLEHGVGEIIVCGIRTEQCCETTTRHASDAGFKVRFALDATLTFAMRAASGKTYTPAEIRERTELVLQDRFAQVLPAAAALAA
ncbi:isochorismatase family protein [Bordetella bronchiseptica MBORD635]|uniref:isochorismatase family protein n=1 Tax=Bordetella bronchiseptica TaxID=518 RepID=UPI0004615F2F|nr:isochorismatase family protein [Bordetella bronchiseptica]KDC80106.1 isochorismatase family protein [Bordetella bronchiseptica MBORD635]